MADEQKRTDETDIDRKHQPRFNPDAGNTGTGADATQPEDPQPGDSSDANENK